MEDLEAQRNALCEYASHFSELLLAHESKLVADLNNGKVKAAELKTSLDASVTHAHFLEEMPTRCKAAQVEKVQYATRFIAADQSTQLDALHREVPVLKKSSKDRQAETRSLTENHKRDREKTLRQPDLVVSDHHYDGRCLREQAEKAENATVNIENRFETVSSHCTSLDQPLGACSAVFGQFLEVSFQDFLLDGHDFH